MEEKILARTQTQQNVWKERALKALGILGTVLLWIFEKTMLILGRILKAVGKAMSDSSRH